MKTVLKSDVESVLKLMLDLHGKTTALDVKQQLRIKGFYAVQPTVSKLLQELTNEKPLVYTFTDSGVYRTYQYVPFNQAVSTLYNNSSLDPHGNFITSGVANQTTKTYPALGPASVQRVVNTAKVALNIGNFEVSDPLGGNKITYNDVTRGQAKYQWVKDTGSQFFKARTRRLDA